MFTYDPYQDGRQQLQSELATQSSENVRTRKFVPTTGLSIFSTDVCTLWHLRRGSSRLTLTASLSMHRQHTYSHFIQILLIESTFLILIWFASRRTEVSHMTSKGGVIIRLALIAKRDHRYIPRRFVAKA